MPSSTRSLTEQLMRVATQADIHTAARAQAHADTFALQPQLWTTTPGPGMPGSLTHQQWDAAYWDERAKIADWCERYAGVSPELVERRTA